jgi:hypothetical protein
MIHRLLSTPLTPGLWKRNKKSCLQSL